MKRAARKWLAAAQYVWRARPTVVVVENVDHEVAVASVLSALVGAPGYEWYAGVLCPWKDLGVPMERRRFFLVGVRCD